VSENRAEKKPEREPRRAETPPNPRNETPPNPKQKTDGDALDEKSLDEVVRDCPL